MRKLLLPFVVLIACWVLISCDWTGKKEAPTPSSLPPITEQGAGTFGCLVNGELMVAVNKCRSTYCQSNPYFDPSLGFTVGGFMDTASKGYRFFVSLGFEDINKEGIYDLDTIAKGNFDSRIKNSVRLKRIPNLAYSLSTIDSGTYCRGRLTISKWKHAQDGFAAGTFWFDLYNPARYPDTVRVRQGRFDVPL